ncbi:MAG: DUF2442 domain-containing protein [Anaerolineae bacterium]
MDTLLDIVSVQTHDDYVDTDVDAEPVGELLDIISVKAHDDYTLELVFENDAKRLFDMNPFFDRKPFDRLRNSPIFFKASIHYGTVTWPGNIDIAPETLWARSVPI